MNTKEDPRSRRWVNSPVGLRAAWGPREHQDSSRHGESFQHQGGEKEGAMKSTISWLTVTLFLGFMAATSVYAADPKGVEIPGNIPQTGDEVLAKKDAEVLRGKLIKVQDGLYTVETAPGQQVSVRAGASTKFEGNNKGSEGDWIEAVATPDMHLESLKKSTPAYTVEGNILKVEGDLVVVKDDKGKEIRLQTGGGTKLSGSHKVGERIKAEYTPEGQALSIKPAKIQRGPEGG